MRLAALLLLVLLPGCLSGSWRRETRHEPPPRGALRSLVVGESDLGDALEVLGAPLWVWEAPADGMAVAYGWLERRGFSLNLSVPVTRDLNASFDYDDVDDDMKGCVLFFDAEHRLVEKRRGWLRDLTVESRRPRPALTEGS